MFWKPFVEFRKIAVKSFNLPNMFKIICQRWVVLTQYSDMLVKIIAIPLYVVVFMELFFKIYPLDLWKKTIRLWLQIFHCSF